MNAKLLSECISVSHQPAELLTTCEDEENDIILLAYSEMPKIYKKETRELEKRGYRISGLTEDSDGTVNVYLTELE